jgi:F0F1-type ATP synthase membrane subunit c/vacuolar-type H+-ATPase subunit K
MNADGARVPTTPEGPQMGPFTSGDPHMSTPVAPPCPAWYGRQPWVGFGALLMVGIGFLLLGIAFGVLTSVKTLAVPTTFWLPVLLVMAAWWHGWPGTSLTASRPLAALIDAIIMAVAALVLTGIFQAILGRSDLGATVSDGGTFPTFPFLIPVSAAAFVVMLQLTFVCSRWPLDKMKPIPAGFCALLICWGIGLLLYFTLCNWNDIPAPARAVMGLHNPGGPINALDFTGWLICLVPYQVIFFQVFAEWPFREYENKLTRIVTSNVFVVGAGWLTWLFVTRILHWETPTIVGAFGMVAVAVNITNMIFEDYPFHHEKPGVARFGLLMNVVGMSFLSFYLLRSIGEALVLQWTNPPLSLWIGIAGLNFIAPVVVFVYAILGRWPLPAPALPAPDDALVIDEFDELSRHLGGEGRRHGVAGETSEAVSGQQ